MVVLLVVVPVLHGALPSGRQASKESVCNGVALTVK